MKNRKTFIIVAILLILTGFASFCLITIKRQKFKDMVEDINSSINSKGKYDFDYSWVKDYTLVAHAFGGKGSKTYTNALEAFVFNYELGHRVFEVDFDITTDKMTICSHDEDYWWYITKNEDTGVEYNYKNFKNTPLFTDYTPLDYMDIINLLNEYPDIYIITDTKYFDKESVNLQFSQIVDYAKEANISVLDRLIPQIYTKEMLEYIMNLHPFKSVIFTLYQITWEAEDIAKFCARKGLKFITVSSAYVGEDNEIIDLWKKENISIAVHTVNEQEEANKLLNKGVDIIYTDFLDPNLFKKE